MKKALHQHHCLINSLFFTAKGTGYLWTPLFFIYFFLQVCAFPTSCRLLGYWTFTVACGIFSLSTDKEQILFSHTTNQLVEEDFHWLNTAPISFSFGHSFGGKNKIFTRYFLLFSDSLSTKWLLTKLIWKFVCTVNI